MLEDNSIFKGKGFGSEGFSLGEVVFTTSHVGYQESLTDPSYNGQILTFAYPLVGNYGILPDKNESEKIWVKGVIVREFCKYPSHRDSIMNLDEFLKKYNIPGVYSIDTRELIIKIREKGAMKGAILVKKKISKEDIE